MNNPWDKIRQRINDAKPKPTNPLEAAETIAAPATPGITTGGNGTIITLYNGVLPPQSATVTGWLLPSAPAAGRLQSQPITGFTTAAAAIASWNPSLGHWEIVEPQKPILNQTLRPKGPPN